MGTTPPRNQPALACIANPLLVTSALIGAIALAWWGHSAVNFGYPVLYDALAIDDHIAEYGPQNRYKAGFEDTSRTQRLRLFDRMVGAINSGGDGLAELTYRPAPEAAPIRLLRDKEVVHLNAVADLVTLLHGAGGTAVGIFLVVLAGMRRARLQLPWQAPWWGFVAVLALALATTLVALDTRDNGWYAWAHDQVFGPEHQWFFVYQESLMTTLLKAPDLFAPLGASLGVTAIACYAGLCVLARLTLSGSSSGPDTPPRPTTHM
jgi:hypothetical protein